MKSLCYFFLASILFFSSCEKPKDNPSNNSNLEIHIFTTLGDGNLEYDKNYISAAGDTFHLTEFRYYLSNFRFVKNDETEVAVDKVLLVDPFTNIYSLGKLKHDEYKAIKFTLGLDSITNHQDPASYSSPHPLAIQSPSMHWSWNSGYLFVKMEGMVDSSNTGNHKFLVYHLGTDDLKREVEASFSFEHESTTSEHISITFDMESLFENVDFRTENTTHTFNNMNLATKLMNNAPNAFNIAVAVE